jgi:hypothetical protein
MILTFECHRCDYVWAREFADEEPIIKLPFFDPYTSRCPSCKRIKHADHHGGGHEPEGGAIG